jgi:DNA-binding LytR/AlgR family response regulator
MIKAIAIDDEIPALKVITNFCDRTEGIRLEQTFQSPAEALRYLQSSPVDLLFLDIQMPSLTGLELYRSVGPGTLAIFTTAYSEYAVEGFNLNAIDYLLKPFTFERFQQAIAKAAEYLSFRQNLTTPNQDQQPNQSLNPNQPNQSPSPNQPNQSPNPNQPNQSPSPNQPSNISPRTEALLIRADYSLIRIPVAEIIFVEAADDYLKIHRENKSPFLARMTMKSILEMLPSDQFIRTHRSYIVSLPRIDNVRNKTIFLSGHEIPISSNYETAFFQHFTR